MATGLDIPKLAQDYAKFTLRRDWLQIEATMKMYGEKPSDDQHDSRYLHNN